MKRFWPAIILSILVPALLGAKKEAKPYHFSAKDQNGKTHTLDKYKGKYVVLEWTNSKCPFVVDHYERNTMVKLYNKFRSKNVVWLAVNSSHFTTPAESKKWTSQKGIPYPTLQDPSGDIGRRFKAERTPHMFVFNPTGKLIYQGAIDDDSTNEKARKTNYVEKALNESIAGRSVTVPKVDAYGCSIKFKK